MAAHQAARAAALDQVEEGLCFARLDTADERLHIGRIGLSDEDGARVLTDWRAPAAAPYYSATLAHPGPVVARRHIRTRGRTVTSTADEVLDPARLADYPHGTHTAHAILVEALAAARTGRMGAIVETIAADQDRIIRADAAGALVIEGGPGTGKTVVALHRAAWLLYQQRHRLERSGVLVIGPSLTFLTYIEAVLPGLGETAVILTPPGRMHPGVDTDERDTGTTATTKGDARMAAVLAAAVADRHAMPAAGTTLDLLDRSVHLPARALEGARRHALGQHPAHNDAREAFLLAAMDSAARRAASARRLDPSDPDIIDDILDELRERPSVRRALNLLWMPITPARLLARLYTDAPWRDRVTAGILTTVESASLARIDGTAWTVDDVPLLDEVAALVGADRTGSDRRAAALAAAERARADSERALATRLMADLSGEVPHDRALDEATDLAGYLAMVDPGALADRWAAPDRHTTLAERALADPSWAYGHVVVDEAQELSAMAWRMVGRRIPSGSLTVVGDRAQTASAAGGGDWTAALSPLARGRVRVETLTTNYRTPAALMAPAASVLAAAGTPATSPTSILPGGSAPTDQLVDAADLPAAAAALAAGWAAQGWRTGIIAPADAVPSLAAACVAAGLDAGSGHGAVSHQVAVCDPWQAKGCEFDATVVVEPAAIDDGAGALYVALTRASRALAVLRSSALPAGLDPDTLTRLP